MKKLIWSIILVVIASTVNAVEPAADVDNKNLVSIEGLVSDESSGETLAGVKVKLEGSDIVRYTDFDGKFRIDNLKPGNYTVSLDYISYSSKKIEKIALHSGESEDLVIKLEPSRVDVRN